MLPVAQPFTSAEIAYRQQRIRADFASLSGGRAHRPRWSLRRFGPLAAVAHRSPAPRTSVAR